MRRIAFINEKGGSCKTTLSVNTASYLALKGFKVLLVDTDPQGAAGKSLGIEVGELDVTLFDVLVGDKRVQDAIMKTSTPKLDILPSNKLLADFPIEAEGMPEREKRLREVISRLRYDIVFFDSPPSMNLLTINVIAASDWIIVPVPLTFLALDGCAELIESVEAVKKYLRMRTPEISLIVPVFWRKTRLAGEIFTKLKEHFGDKVTLPLGFDVKLDEAQSHGKTIWEYASRSKGALTIKKIAERMMKGVKAL